MSEYAAPPKTNVLALVGFIVAFVLPVVGMILGIVARNQLNIPGNPESGRGFARWAIIVGAVGTLFQLAFFILWFSMFFTAMSNSPAFG